MHFAKGTKTETDPSMQESVNEKEVISNSERENEGIAIHIDLINLEFNSDNSDFWPENHINNE